MPSNTRAIILELNAVMETGLHVLHTLEYDVAPTELQSVLAEVYFCK